MTTVAAIVLGFDRLPKTRLCLRSLLRCEGWQPRILLLDNGSQDGTGTAISEEFPSVHVVHSEVNLGAARGRNVAAVAAAELWAPEFLWFVDDDAVVHPEAARALWRPFQAPGSERLAATAAKIRYPGEPPRIYVAGGSDIRLWLGGTSPRGQGDLDVGQYDRPEPCIPGASCTMVRSSAFEQIDGFDVGYDPYGYEDLDLSLRLVEAGWQILYVPEALAWHERGDTVGQKRYTARYARIKRRNWVRFLRRHGSWLERVAFWAGGAPFRLATALFREFRRGNLAGMRGLLFGTGAE